MKKKSLIVIPLLFTSLTILSQPLTLVSGKKIYDHHSSSLSGGFYGDYNVDSQSAYDFVNHAYVSSGTPSLAANRDLVEHNGYFGYDSHGWGIQFGFTNATSNIGNQAAQGNNQTKFYLNNAVSFSTLTTVNSLVAAYNSSLATSYDTAVVTGNVYIARLRNTDTYVAMKITSLSNINQTQVTALNNNQPVTLDVYFEFDYKYGTLTTTAQGKEGIYQTENKLMKIFPNPAKHSILLEATLPYTNYRVLNSIGQTVMHDSSSASQKSLLLDISILEAGIYVVELHDSEGNCIRGKFIKEQ